RRVGARKNAPTPNLPSLPDPEPGGGAATTGGSTLIPPTPNSLLLVRGGGRGFELLLDARDVLRVLQEVLEQPPLALARGGAECRRLLVGHVEDDVLRLSDRSLGSASDRVR